MKLSVSTLFMTGALALSIASGAHAQLGVDVSNGSFDYGASDWNLGYEFTADAPLTVVALGNWLPSGASFPQPQQVGLWTSSGTLLASTYVTNSDTVIGNWIFNSITPVALTAGQTYVVGGQGGADYTGNSGATTFDPNITYVQDLATPNGGANSPLVMPTSTNGLSASNAGWFGGNVFFGTASSTPEPGTYALLGSLGLTGATFLRRRRAR